MRTMDIALRTSAEPAAALAVAIHAEKFAAVAPAVISVTPLSDSDPIRKWKIRFRQNCFSWTERVDYRPGGDRAEFAAVDGDFRSMSGSWRADVEGGGTLLRFEATIDLGVPIFDRIVEPLVGAVLRGAVVEALTRLLPDVSFVDAVDPGPEERVAAYLATASKTE